MPVKRLSLFDPVATPVRAMNTALSPTALSPGEWSQLTNVRIGDRTIQCRDGISAELGTVAANATWQGQAQGQFNGTYMFFVAASVGSETLVYKSDDLATWTEITAASGPYGNTRFAHAGQVQMAITKDPYVDPNGSTPVGDVLIMQNGLDSPRVYGAAPVGAGAYQTAIIETVPDQQSVIDLAVNMNAVAVGYDLFASANTDYATIPPTSANFAFSDTGTTVDNKVRLTIKSGVATSDQATCKFAARKALLQGRQFLIGIDTAYSFLLDYCKIEVGDYNGGSPVWKTIWDPTAGVSSGSYLTVPIDSTQKQLAAFSIEAFQYNTATLTDLLRVTWTSLGVPPPSDQTIDFFLIAGSPATPSLNPGTTFFAITNYNQGSRTESLKTIYSSYKTQRIDNLIGAPDIGVSIPNDPRLWFAYLLSVKQVATGDLDKGVDSVNIYRKRPGETDYLFDETQVTGFYDSGSWHQQFLTSIFTLVAGGDDTALYIPAPSDFMVCMPTASAVASANGRVFTGGQNSNQPRLFISEKDHGFRFSHFLNYKNSQIDEFSSTAHGLRNDTVQRVLAVASSTIGVDTVYIWTDQNLYATSGLTASSLSQITTLAPLGTLCPYSVAELKGTVFWIDKEMQVRRMAGGSIEEISRRVIDNQTLAIPGNRRAYVVGACFNERYYLTFGASLLVWEDTFGVWVNDTTPLTSLDALSAWFDGTANSVRLIATGVAGSNLESFEYESASQDLATTDISVGLSTHELHDQLWNPFVVRRLGVVCDDVSGGSIAWTRTYRPTGVVGSSTTFIDVTTNQAWRWDGDQSISPADVDGNGASCLISATAAMRGGNHIYAIVAEVEPRNGGWDAS